MELLIVLGAVMYVPFSLACAYFFMPLGGEIYEEAWRFNPSEYIYRVDDIEPRAKRVFVRILVILTAPFVGVFWFVTYFVLTAYEVLRAGVRFGRRIFS